MNLERIKDRLRAVLERARARSGLLDHLVRAVEHYSAVMGTQLAAAVTYFAFLSFFPLVALCFAAVGFGVAFIPGVEQAVTSALVQTFPGMIGNAPNQIDVQAIARQKANVGVIGLLVLLYSGLGWVSALRTSLQAVFESAPERKRGLVKGKAYDLLVLVVVGIVLVTSVGVGTAVTGFTEIILDLLGLRGVPGAGALLWVGALLVGVAASVLLFFVIYRVLPRHDVSGRAILGGALLAAIGFEVLKQLASIVIGFVTRNPLYGAFAIMVALLVWINYFSRLAVLGAAWAVTTPDEQPPDERTPERPTPVPDDPTTTP
ncbi:YihY/virulence factor BrkB family protein [Actinopolymorpha sp. B17G11]|uniref:YihY/virulence factor BrkB family protein n=1 Tax=unclassified Actinopolymorpha TaxID=2627063 RepID=UPI0032D8D166